MKIVEFSPKYKKYFIEYNTDWITDNFGKLEKEDKDTFENIEKSIDNGGMIFFAIEDENVLACCVVKPMNDTNNSWEICKLASNKHIDHHGAGSAVFKACIDWAASHGASRLFILSNSNLKAAMHIYHKFGFKEIKLDNYEYERGNIAFEFFLDRNKK